MNQQSVLFAIGVAATAVVQVCAVWANGASADDAVSDAYNWSVLFLMAMPYVVMGSVAGWIFYFYRRGERRRKKRPAVRSAWIHKESGR